jgi:alpha-L-rhamnosidase
MKCAFGILLLSLTTLAPAQTQGVLKPSGLRCEYAADPLGIDVPQPRLFWTVESAERGQRQSAYQILAATSAALLARESGDLWDSGQVFSDETIHIRYAGKPLRSSQQAFWKLRVWDREGRPSAHPLLPFPSLH